MYIKDDEINRIFNEKNWKTAHNYYKDNVITNMSVLKQLPPKRISLWSYWSIITKVLQSRNVRYPIPI